MPCSLSQLLARLLRCCGPIDWLKMTLSGFWPIQPSASGICFCLYGLFTAGIFHLMTHASSRPLFLGAGSLYTVSNEQDMRKMGGLKTSAYYYRTFLIATLAIAGIPGLAGFLQR